MSIGKTYHVAPHGDDANEGSENKPFRTISKASAQARPRDTVLVHGGIYREQVTPAHGGASDADRICYCAVLGESVVITGSEPVQGWGHVGKDTWTVQIGNDLFGSFNPYADLIKGDWFMPKKRKHHTGAVYLNGHWLDEAASLEAVLAESSETALWYAEVGETLTTIWAQFPRVNPNKENVEINVRKTVFSPDRPGIDYITLRGFTLRHAATPWAPPTAGQIGMVSAYWCKGWIIENNDLGYSKCTGIALGKYSDEWDNCCETAEGYVGTIERALASGWNKENIGSHLVRNNHIHHCEQNGIVGSLGCSFSQITGNVIHDIHARRVFDGVEMAGIKFHGPVDVEISDNHIYRTNCGIWLDWMTQGAKISRNLLHDNTHPEPAFGDFLTEANHGPYLVDNNIMLSPHSVSICESHRGTFVHNYFGGRVTCVDRMTRQVPYLKPHSTEMEGLKPTQVGEDEWHHNVVVHENGLINYPSTALPSVLENNVCKIQKTSPTFTFPMNIWHEPKNS